MNLIYNFLILVVGQVLKLVARFNPKIRLFVEGRKTVFTTLKTAINKDDKVIWFHVASLGEFEQGLPVMERLRNKFPNRKILVSFFSPSGYEVKKNSKVADVIVYLPLDTKKNAKRFLDLVQPELAIFVKYEFWPNYLSELKKRNINVLLISAIFRKDQAFFKPYGSWMRKSLNAFEHFFVQDEHSKKLLQKININKVSIAGDTRFDRVAEILEQDNQLDFIANFKANQTCFVIGSSWPEDDKILLPFINATGNQNLKYIIAPHNIKTDQILKLKENIEKKTILFSEKEGQDLSNYEVLIVDTIGLLTKIYSYGDIAYVGGGMGNTGLHNTLEPAVFGIPVIIGKQYEEFKEAKDLVSLGGIIVVDSETALKTALNKLLENKEESKRIGNINANFTQKSKGASNLIVNHVRNLL